jgi:two-component system heavy metal sensor histidine kinase CusS
VGAIYDEHGTPRAWTPGFAEEAPRSGVLHPGREPFDLVGAAEPLRGVMAPVPGRSGAYLLVAAPRAERHGALAVAALAAGLGLALVWSALVLAWATRRLTRAHETAASELRAELDTQKRFVAFAAHELRAPLTLVHGQLALALRRPRQVDEYRSAIGEALDAASHLRSLTEDLLDLERARAQEGGPVAPIALARIVRAASRHVQTAAQSRLVVFEMRVPPLFVLGRASDLERLVRNLLENAVRHSPPGGRIVVEASSSRDRIELAVEDEGTGVAAADRPRVFEPFFRSAVAEDGTGAGLGLAIARAIARAHGGDVTLDASVDRVERVERGARFVVHLRSHDGEREALDAVDRGAAAVLIQEQ